MRRFSCLSLSLIVPLAFAAGCRPADSPSVSATLHIGGTSSAQHGWKVVESDGFSIAFPPNMTTQDMSQAASAKLFEKAEASHPENAKTLEKMKSDPAKGGFKLIAKNQNVGPTGFRNNMTLIVMQQKAGTSVDAMLARHKVAMDHLSVPGTVVAKKIKLPVGEVGYIESEHSRPTGENRAVSTYLVQNGGKLYLFTFASGQPDKGEFRTTASLVMKTLVFTR